MSRSLLISALFAVFYCAFIPKPENMGNPVRSGKTVFAHIDFLCEFRLPTAIYSADLSASLPPWAAPASSPTKLIIWIKESRNAGSCAGSGRILDARCCAHNQKSRSPRQPAGSPSTPFVEPAVDFSKPLGHWQSGYFGAKFCDVKFGDFYSLHLTPNLYHHIHDSVD